MGQRTGEKDGKVGRAAQGDATKAVKPKRGKKGTNEKIESIEWLRHTLKSRTGTTAILQSPGMIHQSRCKHLRNEVVEWLFEIANNLNLPSSVVALAASFLDRHMLTCKVDENHMYFLGSVVLLLASKVRHMSFSMRQLRREINNRYSVSDYGQMEKHVVANLGWDLSSVTCTDYTNAFLTLIPDDELRDSRVYASLLSNMAAAEHSFASVPPHVLSLCCIEFAVEMQKVKAAELKLAPIHEIFDLKDQPMLSSAVKKKLRAEVQFQQGRLRQMDASARGGNRGAEERACQRGVSEASGLAALRGGTRADSLPPMSQEDADFVPLTPDASSSARPLPSCYAHELPDMETALDELERMGELVEETNDDDSSEGEDFGDAVPSSPKRARGIDLPSDLDIPSAAVPSKRSRHEREHIWSSLQS